MAGYTALIKGLFYFESSLRAVEDALGVEGGSWLRAADIEKAIVSVNRRGFGGVLYGLPLSEWEDLLFSQARQALDGNEGRLLDWLEGFARALSGDGCFASGMRHAANGKPYRRGFGSEQVGRSAGVRVGRGFILMVLSGGAPC